MRKNRWSARSLLVLGRPGSKLTSRVAWPTLCELLELTILIAQKDPARHARVAGRWLYRYLEARADATIDDASFVTACLIALGGDRQAEAAASLRAVSKLATSYSGAD